MKKILLLLGYLAGIVVGSKFAKKPTKSNKKPETIGDWARNAGEEIVSVHKRLLDTSKDEYWTEENKQFLFNKKEALMSYLDDFKAEAKEKLDELKGSGGSLSEKGQQELKRIYENRSEYLQKAGNLSKKALQSAQEKLDETFNELNKKVAQTKKKAPAKKKTPAKKTATATKKKPATKKPVAKKK